MKVLKGTGKSLTPVLLIVPIIIFFVGMASASEWALKLELSGYGIKAYSTQQTFDQGGNPDGYIVAGFISSNNNDNDDYWVMKLNLDLTVAWQRTFDRDAYDRAYSVLQTTDGGYVVGGSSYIGNRFQPWILKLNSDGTLAWQRLYVGGNSSEPVAIQQTMDGGFIMGSTMSYPINGTNWTNYRVTKLNPDGTFAWHKIYSWGSGTFTVCQSIKQTTDGGYIVTGNTGNEIYGGYIWVLKLNPDGTVAWQKSYGGTTLGTQADSIQQTFDQAGNPDGYIVSGATESFGAGSSDVWVLRLNLDGSIAWQKAYGGAGAERGRAVLQSFDDQGNPDGYVVAGWTSSFGVSPASIWVLKLNLDGSLASQKTYGGGSFYYRGFDIEKSSNGGYVLAGWAGTDEYLDGHSAHAWVLKLDQNLEILDCGLMGSSQAMVTSTAATIPYNSWIVSEPSVTTTDTTVVPQDSSIQEAIVCAAGETNYPPVLNPIGNMTVNEEEILTFTVTASDGNPGQILSYSASNLPPGANFNTSTHTFSWTPVQGQAGTYPDVLFTVTDNGSPPLSDSEAIAIIVRPKLLVGTEQWAISYGPGASGCSSIEPTFNSQGNANGYIVGGITNTFGIGGLDIWLLRLDLQGNILWQKTYGGSGDENTQSTLQTADGGYVVLGDTFSFGGGDRDIWVLKINSDGSVAWQKTYGGAGAENPKVIQETNDGGYILTATTSSYGMGGSDIWILKLNPDGTVAWQKTYGDSGNDEACSIQKIADGGYIALVRNVDPGGGIRILKLNSNGDIVWQKAYQYGPWYYSLGETHNLEGNPDGYVVMGQTFTSQGREDIAVAKLDLDGNVVWQKAYGGPEEELIYGASNSTIQQTADGGFVLTATSFSFTSVYDDIWVLKLNSDGTVAWEKDYGTTILDQANSIRQTWDGFVVGGNFHMPYGATNIWVLKLNVYGEISGCSLWRNTQAFVNDTSYASSDVNLVAQASSAVPVDTSVIPLDSSAQSNIYCSVIQATIGYSPTSFSFAATQGGLNPSNQSLSISNTSGGTLHWLVSDNAAWLSLSPTSGTNSGTVTVSVNITGLSAGTYNATITITAAGATNSPVDIPVTLMINAIGQTPVIDKILGVKEPGLAVRIIGQYFGDTQGDSIVHIGPKIFNSSSPRIKLWSDTKIRIRLPNYQCGWFKGQSYRYIKAWVTVNGVDSNKKRIKVLKPDICP
jgi:hypothetical protein